MKPDVNGLKKLREFIATGKPKCGTVGCVAGWAAARFPRRFGNIKPIDVDSRRFADAYRISMEDAQMIVYGFEHGYENSKRGALKALDHLISECEQK